MDHCTRIGFTGNRYGLNSNQKEEIKKILNSFTSIIISHGDCVGADTDFHKLCMDYRKEHPDKTMIIHIYPPDNASLRAFNDGDVVFPTKPYLKRNMDILKNSSILIACPVDKNKEQLRSGTWSTMRKARKRQMVIHLL